MKKRRNYRRKSNNYGKDIFRMVFSFLSIAFAIFVVIFVYEKIRGAEFLPSLEMTSQTAETEIKIDTSESGEDEIKNGFSKDSDGNTVYFLEDGTQAISMWVVENMQLYYFNDKGFLQTSSFSESAMNYTFAETGEVENIRYNPSYKPDEESVIQGFDNLVKNKHLWVYTDKSRMSGDFYALMYKLTTEAMSYPLGGNSNLQYCSPNSVQLKDSYVYYLPYTEDPDDNEAHINKKLYRIKAGEHDRYIGYDNVSGFKVIDDYIFVCSDNNIIVLNDNDFVADNSVNTSWMTADSFIVDIESEPGHAFLESADGVRALGYESDEYFKAGNFQYMLSKDGEITDVKNKTSVNIGGYIYKVELDSAFEKPVSRVVRINSAGQKEIISSEFEGAVLNMHYDYESECIFAEYISFGDVNRIIRINLSGDVDYLEDQGLNGGKLSLIAIQDNKAIVKESLGELSNYYALRTRATVPMAIGVDPVLIIGTSDENESKKENKSENKNNTSISKGPGLDIEKGPGVILENKAPDSSDGDSALIVESPGQ